MKKIPKCLTSIRMDDDLSCIKTELRVFSDPITNIGLSKVQDNFVSVSDSSASAAQIND